RLAAAAGDPIRSDFVGEGSLAKYGGRPEASSAACGGDDETAWPPGSVGSPRTGVPDQVREHGPEVSGVQGRGQASCTLPVPDNHPTPFRSAAAVAASAGKKVSSASSDRVMSMGVPKMVVVLNRLRISSPARSRSGTTTPAKSCAAPGSSPS